jgi:hypothetical protein
MIGYRFAGRCVVPCDSYTAKRQPVLQNSTSESGNRSQHNRWLYISEPQDRPASADAYPRHTCRSAPCTAAAACATGFGSYVPTWTNQSYPVLPPDCQVKPTFKKAKPHSQTHLMAHHMLRLLRSDPLQVAVRSSLGSRGIAVRVVQHVHPSPHTVWHSSSCTRKLPFLLTAGLYHACCRPLCCAVP